MSDAQNPAEYPNVSCDECCADIVIGPAIKRDDLVCSLPQPARHHDVIKAMVDAGIRAPIGHGNDVQGFMTRYGFKDRQLTGALVFGKRRFVTSEDLW